MTNTTDTGRSLIIDAETVPVIRSYSLDEYTYIEYRMFGGQIGIVRTRRLAGER